MTAAQRLAVVNEALAWKGAMFRMNSCIRPSKSFRGSVDCGRLPHAIFSAVGLDIPEVPGHWPRDFMCHKMADSEPYLTLIRSKLTEVITPQPGDLAVFKPLRSRCYSHAAIVLAWPKVLHARGVGANPQVEVADATQWPLAGAQVLFFEAK